MVHPPPRLLRSVEHGGVAHSTSHSRVAFDEDVPATSSSRSSLAFDEGMPVPVALPPLVRVSHLLRGVLATSSLFADGVR